MKLSAPKQVTWIIAVVLGVLGILGVFSIIGIPYASVLLTLGFVLLALATLLNGI